MGSTWNTKARQEQVKEIMFLARIRREHQLAMKASARHIAINLWKSSKQISISLSVIFMRSVLKPLAASIPRIKQQKIFQQHTPKGPHAEIH